MMLLCHHRLHIVCTSIIASLATSSIPNIQTKSGYDTNSGNDPICWMSEGSLTEDNATQKTWQTELIQSNSFHSGATEMLPSCPNGLDLEVYTPHPGSLNDWGNLERGQEYRFRVRGNVSLEGIRQGLSLPDAQFFSYSNSSGEDSSASEAHMSVQVILCRVGKIGFCNPFAYEEHDPATTNPIESDFVFVDVVNATSLEVIPVDCNVSMPAKWSNGTYFIIGVLRFFIAGEPLLSVSSNDSSTLYKFDVSTIIDNHVLSTTHAPQYLTISRATIIFCGILIGIGALIQIILLGCLIYYRKHIVLQLSQGKWLILFVLAAVAATVPSFLFNPKNDLYCRLSLPLSLVPLQLMLAIAIGRLWRIRVIMVPLLNWANTQSKNDESKLQLKLKSVCCPKPKQTNLKRTVTDLQLASVVFIITLPQVIAQIVLAALDNVQAVTNWNDDRTFFYTTCYYPHEPVYHGIFFITLIVLLAYANYSRDLPSLFNEAKSLFTTVLHTTVAVVVGVAFILVTHVVESAIFMDVKYLFEIVIVISFTLNMSIRLIYPKLKIIWSGEKISLNNILREARIKSQKQQKQQQQPVMAQDNIQQKKYNHVAATGVIHDSKLSAAATSGLNNNTEEEQKPFIIAENEPPPEQIFLDLVAANGLLSRVSDQLLTGLNVAKDDWESLKTHFVNLGNVFECVEFQWQENDNENSKVE